MKNQIKNVILVIAIQICLGSCTRNSPESTGKKWADKSCECFRIYREPSLTIADELKQKAKNGSFKTMDELMRAQQEMIAKADFNESNERSAKCYKELKELEQKIKLDFAKEVDRQTIKNAFDANREMCEKEINLAMEFDTDEMRDILGIPSKEDERKALIEKGNKEYELAKKQEEEAAKATVSK